MMDRPAGYAATARKIWELLTGRERRRAVALIALMFVSMVMETLGVAFIMPTVALLTQRDLAEKYPVVQPLLQWLGNPSQDRLVIGGMGLLVGGFLVKNSFMALLAWRQSSFSFGVRERLSQQLFGIYLRQPYVFHLQRNSAQLIHHAFDEVSVLATNVIQPTMILLAESLVMLSLCTLLLLVEPLGSLISLVILALSAGVFHRLTAGHVARWGRARHRHEGLRIQHLQQGLGSAKDVILLGRQQEFLDQYAVHNAQTARVARLQFTMMQLPRLWLELLAVIGLSIVVASMLLRGRDSEAVLLTLGLFAAAAFRLMPSVNRILGSVQSLNFGLPAIIALHEEFRLNPIQQATDASVGRFNKALELKAVTYTYLNATKPALTDISLTIRRGELVGFVGTSGAGKSTLVDIILGLLTPESGDVCVDGKSIQPALRQWQDQVGYVPQSIFLTDDTLRRNVAFGIPSARIDEAAVWRAIRAAQLEDFVRSLPEGLDAMVGERGVRISGGQRQRIGIARALYHEPGVIVLDEATSSLDTVTERDFMEAVRALQGSKTIIIVAHRLSTVEICDRLYRLESGRIVDQGSFDDIARILREAAVPLAADAGPKAN